MPRSAGYTGARMGLRKKLFGIASDVLRPESLLGAGSKAPGFDLAAHDGTRVRTADLEEASHYVLVFYPADDTPGCTDQLAAFDALRDRFAKADCRLYGVNPGSVASHKSFADAQGYGFPLLVDDGRKTAIAHRTARPGVPAVFRSVFHVDKRGVVRLAMKGSPDPESVLASVERSNLTGFKGAGRKGRRLVPEVSGYGMRKLQDNDPETRVLDIRDPADWAAGHVPGAINVPIDGLGERLGELPGKDTPLVVACDQGLRAPSAARILKDAGWRKLYTLIDGMEAYKGQLESSS